MKVRENWIDGRTDSPTVAAGDDHLGDGSNDADCGLLPHGVERLVNGGDTEVFNDLSLLHALTGGDVQVGHVALDIGIANDRVHREAKDEIKDQFN